MVQRVTNEPAGAQLHFKKTLSTSCSGFTGLLYSNHLCKILEAIAPQIEVYVGQLWALLDQVAARKEEAEAKPAAAEKGACEAKAAPAEVEDTNSNSVSEAAAAEKAKEQSKETEQVAEPEEPKVEDDEKEATPE